MPKIAKHIKGRQENQHVGQTAARLRSHLLFLSHLLPKKVTAVPKMMVILRKQLVNTD